MLHANIDLFDGETCISSTIANIASCDEINASSDTRTMYTDQDRNATVKEHVH